MSRVKYNKYSFIEYTEATIAILFIPVTLFTLGLL